MYLTCKTETGKIENYLNSILNVYEIIENLKKIKKGIDKIKKQLYIIGVIISTHHDRVLTKINKGGINMFGLTPFNRNNVQRTNNNEFENFYSMVDNFFNDSFFPMRNLRNDTFKIDVRDNMNEYLIEAEMPGVKKEDIKIDYNEGRLMIAVHRDEQVEEERNNYIHRERRLASMQRGVYLKNVKPDGITAKLEDGVLKIKAPKVDTGESKYQIEIE